MANDNAKRKGTDAPTKPRSRSFCCSMFIYTFVFVSGVVVATILPDLAGHHFKQPYGKEYGVMAEKLVQDLPKYLKKFSDTMMVISSELGNRVWALKTELEKRYAEATKGDGGKAKTTSRPSSSSSKSQKSNSHSHSHSHGGHGHAHDHDHDEEM